MENIKSYIESGILELYVLGDVTPEEKLQVEAMALKHYEVKAELGEIELAMELYAKDHSIKPSENLRGRTLNSILTNYSDDSTFADDEPYNNVVSFSSPKTNSFYKYAFAACLALLLASIAGMVSMYNRLQDSNDQLAALRLDKQHFANQVNFIHKQLDDSRQEISVFRDPSFKFLKLNGTPHAPAASLTIAWSPVKHKVLIDMHSVKMPENDKAHQYQLWAIVAGKPVDLGVFDDNPDATDMKEMKTIDAVTADAFAVTLEPRGGSVNPTMDKMMVIGKF